MAHRCFRTFLAAICVSGLFAANASAFEFAFTAQCDDCAFEGSPSDPGFDPLGDGLFETVSGTLRLTDVSLNVDGFIEVDSNNFASFTYDGSSLINAFSFDDAFLIRGLLSPTGEVQPAEALRLETSDGSGGSFDFPNFCTSLGEEVLGTCFGVGLVSFEVDSTGSWFIEGTEPFDVGVGGQLVLVPEPASAALVGLGVLGIACARRRAIPARSGKRG